MNRKFSILCGGLLAATLNVYTFAHDGDHKSTGKSVTVIGELVDTACFIADGSQSTGKTHAKCARKCMASGLPAGILPDAKNSKGMLFLLTNPAVLAPHAAKTIKVEGTVNADLRAIDPKKVFVQEGDSWKEVHLKDEHHGDAGEHDAHGDHKEQ
jgi:hypothetical protein